MANVVFLAVTQLLSDDAFQTWGWRVPFLMSAVLVGVAMWIRLGVFESPAFAEAKESDTIVKMPIVEVLTRNWRTVLLAAGTFIATNGIATCSWCTS